MLKKLSLILAAVTLCANMGIVAPVSAQTATEEKVLIESNFQNCNLGTYTKENQKNGETDLRNGVVMTDNDVALSTGYTIKNGDSYESISEADIVDDGGTKVLRLNTFLSSAYNMGNTAEYPVVQTNGTLPESGKVRVDLDIKLTHPAKFWMYHSTSTEGGAYGIWRFERYNGSYSKIKVLDNTDTGRTFQYGQYNKLSVIMDTITGDMNFYLEDELIKTETGLEPRADWQLYLRQGTVGGAGVTYNEADGTKIESVTNPQYVYIKSLKVTTYTDIELESATPAVGSKIMTPTEAVFTFNKEIRSVQKAEVSDGSGSEPVDVTASVIKNGKTVEVPYAFEDGKTYTVTLTGASDGLTSTNATTSFTTEAWKFSNLTGNPANSSPEDKNRYFINEDFTNSDDTNIIVEANRNDGWYVGGKGDGVSIVTLDDGNKALQILGGDVETLFQIQYNKNLNLLDNTTTISFDVYIEAGTRSFATYREVNGVKYLETNCFKGGWAGKVMTDGQWHKVAITLSDTAGTTLYIDGARIVNTPKADGVQGLSATGYFRFVVAQGKVQIDNFKLYLDKNKTELTAVTPAYDATDVSVSDAIEFTYNSEIGDLSGAKLILKPNDTNEATVLTNGNGMTVSSNGNKVKITLADALEENTGYALEFSGIKNRAGSVVDAIKTKFSTVYDSSWEVKEFESTVQSASSKKYSIKVKNETDAAGACMAVAVYDENGYLEDVVFSDPAESSDGWVELDATVNYTDGNTSKIFIWDSVGDMNLISGIITD